MSFGLSSWFSCLETELGPRYFSHGLVILFEFSLSNVFARVGKGSGERAEGSQTAAGRNPNPFQLQAQVPRATRLKGRLPRPAQPPAQRASSTPKEHRACQLKITPAHLAKRPWLPAMGDAESGSQDGAHSKRQKMKSLL